MGEVFNDGNGYSITCDVCHVTFRGHIKIPHHNCNFQTQREEAQTLIALVNEVKELTTTVGSLQEEVKILRKSMSPHSHCPLNL